MMSISSSLVCDENVILTRLECFPPDNHLQSEMTNPLYSVPAGKMVQNGRSVIPDERLGTLDLLSSPEGSGIKFCWKPTRSSKYEDEFLVLPGQAEISKVPQANDSRVFLLKLKDSNVRFFFWLQDTCLIEDSELITKLNSFITQSVAANPPAAKPSGSSSKLTLNSLQSVLQTVKRPRRSNQSLKSLLSAEKVKKLLEDPLLVEKCCHHLPPGAPATRSQVESIVSSPQFSQFVDLLDQILSSDQLPEFITSLGMDSSVCSQYSGADALLEAIKKNKTRKE